MSEEEVEHIEDATTRLAIQNCDWMHIKLKIFLWFYNHLSVWSSCEISGSILLILDWATLDGRRKYGPAVVWREANDEDDDSENDDGNDRKKKIYTSID